MSNDTVFTVVCSLTALFALAGAWFGWRHGTNRLYVREDGDYATDEIRPGLLLKRKVERLLWVALGATGGALAAMGMLFGLARA